MTMQKLGCMMMQRIIFESIDFNQIKELCESILNAITDFKLSMYNKFLKDYKDIDLDIDENDIKLVGEFKLINKKETLIGNGYDVQKKIYLSK